LEGTDVAQRVQKEIVAQAKEIIQKKEVLQTGPFRSLVISEAKSLNYFCHPLTLSQLAHFLVDTLIVCYTRISLIAAGNGNRKKSETVCDCCTQRGH
jgi:hypothetical protein